MPATLLKKRLWHRCAPVNFAKFLRTPFLQNTSGWLLLNSHLLSLISEPITAPATVHHAANIAKNITGKLNPDQNLIITADQPVCALGKQLQWMYPAEINNVI